MTRSMPAALLLLAVLVPVNARAQDAPPPTGQPVAPQDPPVAVAEEAAKPTRGFFSALGHNLGDDVKHMPRWNSVYWLAGGGALALAVHPVDKDINAHFAPEMMRLRPVWVATFGLEPGGSPVGPGGITTRKATWSWQPVSESLFRESNESGPFQQVPFVAPSEA